MKNILEGKIVKFIAVDRKYLSTPYPAIAPLSDSINTYVTGQHVDPEDPSSIGNLTVEEMIGEKALNASKMKLFPYVINPENIVFINHNKRLNCKVDNKGKPLYPKDYAEAHFIILQDWIVAPNKMEVKPSKHKFFLEDKDSVAKAEVLKEDKIYAAKKLIYEEASVENYGDIIMLLNQYARGFNVTGYKSYSDQRLKQILLNQASEFPETIVFAFSDQGENFLHLAKLIEANVLKKKSDGYYDQNLFIAATANNFVNFMKDVDNVKLVEKWGRLLKEQESDVSKE